MSVCDVGGGDLGLGIRGEAFFNRVNSLFLCLLLQVEGYVVGRGKTGSQPGLRSPGLSAGAQPGLRPAGLSAGVLPVLRPRYSTSTQPGLRPSAGAQPGLSAGAQPGLRPAGLSTGALPVLRPR